MPDGTGCTPKQDELEQNETRYTLCPSTAPMQRMLYVYVWMHLNAPVTGNTLRLAKPSNANQQKGDCWHMAALRGAFKFLPCGLHLQ